MTEIDALALALPVLMEDEVLRGHAPTIIDTINAHPEPESSSPDRVWRPHVHIGSELHLLDFAARLQRVDGAGIPMERSLQTRKSASTICYQCRRDIWLERGNAA
jgi:hypothetical protein